MNRKVIFSQPYFILWVAVPVILIIAYFRKSFVLDIQLSDTYYVIPIGVLGGFFSIMAGFNGLVYWLFKTKNLVETATWIQVIGSILTALFLVVLAGSVEKPNLAGTFLSAADFKRDQDHNTQVLFGMLIWIVSQILFLLNVTVGLVRSTWFQK
jgi:hypothetical protein